MARLRQPARSCRGLKSPGRVLVRSARLGPPIPAWGDMVDTVTRSDLGAAGAAALLVTRKRMAGRYRHMHGPERRVPGASIGQTP